MKKIISICVGFILFLWVTMYLASCTPVRYVYVDQKDSVVKKQRVVYDNLYVPSPFFFNYGWGVPYYNPIIIQRHRPIVVPQRPHIQPNRWYGPTITHNRWSAPQRPLPPRTPRQK
jgi:hypothetical protein